MQATSVACATVHRLVSDRLSGDPRTQLRSFSLSLCRGAERELPHALAHHSASVPKISHAHAFTLTLSRSCPCSCSCSRSSLSLCVEDYFVALCSHTCSCSCSCSHALAHAYALTQPVVVLVWFSLVWFSLVWFGLVQFGSVWLMLGFLLFYLGPPG